MLETPKEVKAERIDRGNSNDGKIRIVDDEGHLLFCYNPDNHCIEIVPSSRASSRGKKFSVSIDVLKVTGNSNLFADDPVKEVVLQEEKDKE